MPPKVRCGTVVQWRTMQCPRMFQSAPERFAYLGREGCRIFLGLRKMWTPAQMYRMQERCAVGLAGLCMHIVRTVEQTVIDAASCLLLVWGVSPAGCGGEYAYRVPLPSGEVWSAGTPCGGSGLESVCWSTGASLHQRLALSCRPREEWLLER